MEVTARRGGFAVTPIPSQPASLVIGRTNRSPRHDGSWGGGRGRRKRGQREPLPTGGPLRTSVTERVTSSPGVT